MYPDGNKQMYENAGHDATYTSTFNTNNDYVIAKSQNNHEKRKQYEFVKKGKNKLLRQEDIFQSPTPRH